MTMAALAVLVWAGRADADPQASVGLTVGGAGRGYGKDLFYEPAFHLGLRADTMFGRTSGRDFGVGPYVELMTHAFDELQFGGGAALLLPAFDSLPFVVSAGAYGRYTPLLELEPGIASSIFFGSRSYNFSSSYVLALGVLVQARIGLGDSRETSFVFGLQVDTGFAALPLVLAIEGARGGSPETDPVQPVRTSPVVAPPEVPDEPKAPVPEEPAPVKPEA